MKKYQIIISMLFATLLSISSVFSNANIQKESWELGFSAKGVSVFYDLIHIENESFVLLKVINETSNSVEVNWDEVVAFSKDNVFEMINPTKLSFVATPGLNEVIRLKKESSKSIEPTIFENVSHLGFKNVILHRVNV